ncbi:MAG: hypothetical protein JW870_15435 [Candidatus Delongbacteria bacterium]|nr:hypothetical protein [Candidatus Delongbacteria bacterium]
MTDFVKHDLVLFLVTSLHDFISRQEPQRILSPPTRQEKYAEDILMSADNIIECINQIYFTIELLSGFRKRNNTKMNRHDYIVFMIENFYLRITSVFDRSLRFTNLVFEIGLPEKECRESTIIKNNKIKNTQTGETLKKLNNIIGDFKMIRNHVAHSQGFFDEKLKSVATYHFLIESNDNKEMKMYDHFIKTKADNYIKKKKSEFTKITVQFEEIISELFNNVLPIVKTNHKKYNE